MGIHTITHFLGGTAPVEADYIVGRNGDLELSEARIGDPDRVGELVNGKWKTLSEILGDRASEAVEAWLAEDVSRDRELMRG